MWDGFDDLPWKYHNEEELRQFLLDRVRDSFSFPMNPIWPVRDPGWYDVFQALQDNTDTSGALSVWFPKTSGILDRIQEIHRKYPGGYNPQAEPEQPAGGDRSKERRRTYSELDHQEKADIMMLEMERGAAKLRKTILKQVIPKAGAAAMLRKMRTATMEGAGATTAQASVPGS